MADCKVRYVVPPGEYKYCKLTYKKDEMPVSVNDGHILNLDATGSELEVTGLEKFSDYWFVIYTDKSESVPYPFKSGDDDLSPFTEAVEVQKQTGEDTFVTVYSWHGKWGKPDEIEVNRYGVTGQQEFITIMEGVTPMKYGKVQQQDNIIITDYKGNYDEVSVSVSDTITISEIVSSNTTTNEIASNIINFTEEASAEIVTEEE